jgi:Ca2+-binding RTX toxin-like protein
MNSQGTILRADDNGFAAYGDSTINRNSQILFFPEYTGIYFCVAGSVEKTVGDYYLSVSEMGSRDNALALLKPTEVANYYRSWRALGDNSIPTTITYSFPSALPSDRSSTAIVGYATMSAGQQDSVRGILQRIESAVGIDFVEVDGEAGKIRFATSDQADSAGVTYSRTLGSGQLSRADVLVNNTYPAETYPVGSYQYNVVIHEIGHALGLKHPRSYNDTGGASVEPYLATSQDTVVNTVMSYNDNSRLFLGTTTDAFPNPFTLMALDVEALQFLYGKSMNSALGDDTYKFDQSSIYSIWDCGGTDQIDLSVETRAVTVQLQSGSVSYQGVLGVDRYGAGLVPRLSISSDVQIENAIGGFGGDIIVGNNAANVLVGGGGNDTIDGGGENDTLRGGVGDDLLVGGEGFDTAVYDASHEKFSIAKSADGYVITGSDQRDMLIGIEVVEFSDKK